MAQQRLPAQAAPPPPPPAQPARRRAGGGGVCNGTVLCLAAICAAAVCTVWAAAPLARRPGGGPPRTPSAAGGRHRPAAVSRGGGSPRRPSRSVSPSPPAPPPTPPPPSRPLRETTAPTPSEALSEAPAGAASPEAAEWLEPRIRAAVPRERWGAELPAQWAALRERVGCDIFTVPFDESRDAPCLVHLSDISNWDAATIAPMAQTVGERTIKFKISSRADPRLRAIVKVPQRMYPSEPLGEVAAFAADRALGTRRIPPTAWARAPVGLLLNATMRKEKMRMVPQYARDSGISSGAFPDWVQQDFVDFTQKARLVDATGAVSPSSPTYTPCWRRSSPYRTATETAAGSGG
eukprot:TRINITY_DN16474_c0_g1_i2.p2 TRINITY_DN16474_c0_g1~~TRINITY_DN16474_c0_g1_i2.p2  ORF type:complete len:350 (+),score=53.38 TRINITY_DN16474_c0_g1_i2:91-1140(+)